MRKTIRFVLLCGLMAILLVACSSTSSTNELNYRRGLETDIPIEVHASNAIQAFQADYPEMSITKLRWIQEIDGTEIYIVEGIHHTEKRIIQYLISEQRIADRVERPLNESEMIDGKSIQQPLVFDKLLT